MNSLTNIPSNVGIYGDRNTNPNTYFIADKINLAYSDCLTTLGSMQDQELKQQESLLNLVKLVYEKSFKYVEKAIDNKKTYELTTRSEYFSESYYTKRFTLDQYLSFYEPEMIAKRERSELEKIVNHAVTDVSPKNKETTGMVVFTEEEFLAFLERALPNARSTPKTPAPLGLNLVEEEFKMNKRQEELVINCKHAELIKLIKIQEQEFPHFKNLIDLRQTFLSAEKSKISSPSEIQLAPKSNQILKEKETRLLNFLNELSLASKGETSPIYTPVVKADAPAVVEPKKVVNDVPASVTPTSLTESQLPQTILAKAENIQPVEAVTEPIANTSPEKVRASLSYDAGWGRSIGICCAPDWDSQPISFSYDWNKWCGEVPVGKEWKFALLQEGKFLKWEKLDGNRIIKAEEVTGSNWSPSNSVRF